MFVKLQFSRYAWEAVYNPETNRWICSEYILLGNSWDKFNTYETYDDSIEQVTASIFATRH